MSSRCTTSIDKATQKFISSLSKIAATSKKDLPALAMSNFAGVIRNLFGLTPPMWASFIRKADKDTSVDFDRGLAKSDSTILKDVSTATWNFKNSRNFKGKDLNSRGMATVTDYLRCRNAKKRYAGGFGNKPISDYDFRLLNQVLHNRQGFTAAGWVAAAKAYGAGRIPRWVSRHAAASGGASTFVVNERVIRMRAINPTKHVNSAGIQARVSIAIRMQVNAMERQLADYFNKKFKGESPWQ